MVRCFIKVRRGKGLKVIAVKSKVMMLGKEEGLVFFVDGT